MNRFHTADVPHNRRRTIVPAILAVAVAAIVMSGAVDTARAMDQSAVNAIGAAMPNPNPGVIPQAPVGHRQPTARDLPSSVRNSEGARAKGDKEIDDALKSICRGC